jgi:hypothetical protein
MRQHSAETIAQAYAFINQLLQCSDAVKDKFKLYLK